MNSNAFRTTFSHRHAILPVIHVQHAEQALANAAVAFERGCDGLFLINHSISHQALMQIYREVRQRFPGVWLGVNSLGSQVDELFDGLPGDLGGVWSDNAEIDETSTEQPRARAIAERRRASGWQGLYFGGVAFKYQRPVLDLAQAARVAAEYMDVVTTSGDGTGHAAAVEKIREMKQALGEHPLAIASGITPENVSHYLGIADCFLVATGISRTFTMLDPDRVEQLVQAVRSYRG